MSSNRHNRTLAGFAVRARKSAENSDDRGAWIVRLIAGGRAVAAVRDRDLGRGRRRLIEAARAELEALAGRYSG